MTRLYIMQPDGLRSLALSEQGLCTRVHGYVGLFSSNGRRLVHGAFYSGYNLYGKYGA